MKKQPNRRQYLATLSTASAIGLAGCSQSDSETQPSEAETPSANLGGAKFTFEYATTDQQVIVQFKGGARVLAGDLEVRSSAGPQVRWAELGSTVAGPDDPISSGASAVLGADIINWGQVVEPTEMIRLVHVGGETPATLGRFTPTESSTLTSTVPSTPTEEPTDTPTEAPDTTAPLITAFSLSNPSGQKLRTSFESDEDLATIEVNISGAESATLATGDFTESISGGTYTYEATYQASSDGDYTATLDVAADVSGNDGASQQSVSLTVTTVSETIIEDFEGGSLAADWTGVRGGGRSGFVVQSDTVGEGTYALSGAGSSNNRSDIARNDFIVDTDGASIQFYAKLGPVLTGYEAANKVRFMAAPSDNDDQREEVIMFDQKDRSEDPNDDYTPPEGQISSENLSSLTLVELNDIDFTESQVGEVMIGGELYAENINFIEEYSQISRIEISDGNFGNQTEIIVDEIVYGE